MAIALAGGSGTGSAQATSTNTVTISSFSCSGSNKILIVWVGSSSGSGAVNTTSVVRGGSETFTEEFDVIRGDSDFHLSLHYFKSPADAAANIVVTLGGTQDEVFAGAICLTGVDQTTPFGTYDENEGVSNTPSVTVTAADTDWIVDCCYAYNGSADTPTVGADQTEKINQQVATTMVFGLISTQLGSVAGDTMTWTLVNPSSIWVHGAVPVQEAGGAERKWLLARPT